MEETSDLADYRQQVVELYLAEPTGGPEGLEAFRQRRDRLFREHPRSALSAAQKARFVGLAYFPYASEAIVRGRPIPCKPGDELVIDTGGEDGAVRYRRVARLATPFGQLTVFWTLGYGGGLFLPFRDGTAGKETYGAGRYLTDTIKGTFGRGLRFDPRRGEITLDFNYSYDPSCAYNPRWACPLAPPENWLDPPVRAGELAFPDYPDIP